MIAGWAYKYVGLPYRDACWGPDEFDCWGLLSHVYREEFGLDVTRDMTMYDSRIGKIKRLVRYVQYWTPVKKPEIGDAILFLIQGRSPHCGVYVGDHKMLHSVEGISSCIQKFDVPRWKSRFEGYYRYNSRTS